MKVQFKDNIKGIKYSVEEGTIEEVYYETLNESEVQAFNKFSNGETIFCCVEDVVDSFGLLLNDDFDCVVSEIEGWGLDEVVEVIN